MVSNKKIHRALRTHTTAEMLFVWRIICVIDICLCDWLSDWVSLKVISVLQKHCGGSIKKIVELWCLCCIMMFRRVNKQPGMQKFWNWCSHYQEIYDWISPPNKRSGWTFILDTVVYGGKWVWWIWSLVYFHSFEALNDAFEVQFFSGLHFYTLTKTLIGCRDMQLRFIKVRTLLNNAFNPALMGYIPAHHVCFMHTNSSENSLLKSVNFKLHYFPPHALKRSHY